MLSISMIKLCRNSICKPLSIIFNDCLKESKMIGKKLVLYQFTRKEQCLKNYRPISLLQSAAKKLEIPSYNIIRKDYPSNIIFQGLFLLFRNTYFKEHLSVVTSKNTYKQMDIKESRYQIRQKFFGERQWIIKLCPKHFMKMFPDSWNTENATERCLRVVTL